MEKKYLEERLNKEYAGIGKITVGDMEEVSISIDDIDYVGSILDNVEPLGDSSEPIIVAKEYSWSDRYILIDGYHRLKHHILKHKENIKAVLLKGYKLRRHDDTLLGFIKRMAGKTIKFYDNYTFELNGRVHYIKTNEGCGGCSNGWSDIEVLPEFIGKSINIADIDTKDGEYDDLYDLYINKKLFAKVDTGWGNGYYGGDFEIII